MAWSTMIPGYEIENIREDRRNTISIEQYRVSAQAVYIKSEYLPIARIKGLTLQPSLYTPRCCCGKGIPVFKIGVDYGADRPAVLMVEKEKNAEKLISEICKANGEVRVDRSSEKLSGSEI